MSYDPEINGAIFDSTQKYRYLLWRKGKNPVTFIMLNPSIADALVNDHTIDHCLRFVKKWGYDGLVVANLFALRSTDPKRLKVDCDPFGPGNLSYIDQAANISKLTVCAWGNHGVLHGRGDEVLHNLRKSGKSPKCIKMTLKKQPIHPLYQSLDLPLIEIPA